MDRLPEGEVPLEKMLACANLIVCRASRFSFSSLILERKSKEIKEDRCLPLSIETFPDLFHNIMTRLFQILFFFSVLTGATAADGRIQRRRMKEEVHQKDVFKAPSPYDERNTRRGL